MIFTDRIDIIAPGITTDVYNNVVDDWSTATETTNVPATVEPATDTGREVIGARERDQALADFRVRVPPGYAIESTYRIRHNERIFSVVGIPARRRSVSGLIDHQEFDVLRSTG